MCYGPESMKSEGMLVVEIIENNRQQGGGSVPPSVCDTSGVSLTKARQLT